MTKEEMLKGVQKSNYDEAQRRIREAMEKGESYVYLPGKNSRNDFTWCATYDTIEQLRQDGFAIDEVWDPWEYWSIEWYDHS